ncbi:olfactory receptor 52A1-like [Pelobates fuscus]|uniref:olfactory receptor 52A1-like n=1 Tax=Pelobates fuscus TaxID=191477 RepID=UPI002FE490CB
MAVFNVSSFYPTFLILVGIPGLEASQWWIGIFFCSFYIISLLGNMTLIIVIPSSPRLNEPMFTFLLLLSTNDVLLSTSLAPKLLSIIWSSSNAILFDACLLQMCFLHAFSSFESGLLLAMAYDRYIAICNPLRYSSIINDKFIVKVIFLIFIRALILISPAPFLIKRFHSFKTNVIAHSYCEHMAVVKLVNGDIWANSVYGLMVAFTIVGTDILLILLSYSRIFHAVYSLSSKEARLKAFNTCTPHMCVFFIFYVLAIFSFLSHRYGKHIPIYVHIVLSNTYILVPSMLNPLVYGLKTKLIREHVWIIVHKTRNTSLQIPSQ